RLIALKVHDYVAVAPSLTARYLGNAIGAGGMRRSRQPCLAAQLANELCDALVIRSDNDLLRTGASSALVHPLNHGLAGQGQQRLARQPGRAKARRNDDAEHTSGRVSSS